MQFLMLVCKDTAPVPTPRNAPDVDEWVETMDARGARLFGNPLEDEKQARTVRVRGDELLVTDGPFLETNEILAGFDVLECAGVEEAIEIARAHPMAHYGVIELRRIITD